MELLVQLVNLADNTYLVIKYNFRLSYRPSIKIDVRILYSTLYDVYV